MNSAPTLTAGQERRWLLRQMALKMSQERPNDLHERVVVVIDWNCPIRAPLLELLELKPTDFNIESKEDGSPYIRCSIKREAMIDLLWALAYPEICRKLIPKPPSGQTYAVVFSKESVSSMTVEPAPAIMH